MKNKLFEKLFEYEDEENDIVDIEKYLKDNSVPLLLLLWSSAVFLGSTIAKLFI